MTAGRVPPSFLVGSDAGSFKWRQDFIRTYLERDIPQFGPRVPGFGVLWVGWDPSRACRTQMVPPDLGVGIDPRQRRSVPLASRWLEHRLRLSNDRW